MEQFPTTIDAVDPILEPFFTACFSVKFPKFARFFSQTDFYLLPQEGKFTKSSDLTFKNRGLKTFFSFPIVFYKEKVANE